MSKEYSGSCLCGAVALKMNPPHEAFGACHCGMCRKWGGGPFLSINAGPNVEILGEENITKFKSSDWAQRAFCKQCGTHLFYLLNDTDYSVAYGIFSDPESLKFDHQIFIDKKPASYSFANDTENLTEAQVFAKYSNE